VAGALRIAQACPYGWDSPGGVQVHVRQLAARLREDGHEVVVLAPARGPVTEPGVRVVGRPIRIPYNGSIAPISPRPSALRAVARELEAFRPDVVHVHEPLTPSVGMFAALRSRAPVVATFHAYADRSFLLAGGARALRPVWRRLAVRIAVSEAAASFVGRTMGNGIRIVPNGVEVELFEHAGVAASLPAGRRILFVNRLDPRKGFAVLARAFPRILERVPDAVLVVAGDGPERSALDRMPAEARERVVMLGAVPHHLLPPYHAAGDVFVSPAVGRESFGIVLVEAMAAGLPVVASDIPGYREVVRDGVEGLLVSPSDPKALAEAVVTVLTDDELARRLGSAGRERARDFSWDVVASRLEEIYREVAG
jgi:phosphatidyl-myo-inositol alpha-mannosyltransferase